MLNFYLLVRFTIKEKFEISQSKVYFPYYHFSHKNKIVYLQPNLFCSENNLFKNNSKKAFEPTDMTKTQAFHIYKMKKVVIITKYINFVIATFEIVLPCFESFNNSQKLTIVCFVSSFGQNFFLWIVSY